MTVQLYSYSSSIITDAPSPIPFTLEHLLPELLPLASKWQSLGEALSLDDDRLDEIFTNNETDDACLQEMLELYMIRPDLDHSWEEVQEAVKKIREFNDPTNGISCKLMLPVTIHNRAPCTLPLQCIHIPCIMDWCEMGLV